MGKPYPEHVSRFYSLALGKSQNFNASTAGTIEAGDTTPDVSLYSLLYNLSTNTISYFDNAVEGQLISVVNLPAENCTLSGAQMKIADSSSLAQNNVITVICHNSSFYEVARTNVNETRTQTQASHTASSINLDNTDIFVLVSTVKLMIKGISGGYEGQQVTFIKTNSCNTTFDHSLTGLFISGSAQDLVMQPSDTCIATKINGTWFAQRPYGSWAV